MVFVDFLSLTLDAVGTILIGIMALRVHHSVLRSEKIDKHVKNMMCTEQLLGYWGIAFIVGGYLINLIF